MGDRQVRLREQISNLHSLFVLSMMMMESRREDEITSLAVTSVGALGPCRVEGAYLASDAGFETFAGLGGDEGSASVEGSAWGRAYPLRSLGGHWGYLVVGAPAEPTTDEQFLLRVLAHQTGTALENAALHQRERAGAAELRRVNKELAAVNDQLAATVADLQRTAAIHEELTRVSATGTGEEAIARVLHDLTRLPVAVEDRFGNLRTWAGPDRPDPYPKPDEGRRTRTLRLARREGRPVRDGKRLIALAQPRDEVLGVLCLIDPDGRATPHDVFALEHGALVLAMELAHERGLAEMELRLRGDLVDDLVTGADAESAYARAEAAGYDLHRPHTVVVVAARGGPEANDTLTRAVERAARDLDLGALVGRRSGAVVLLAHGAPQWEALFEILTREFPAAVLAVGVGTAARTPAEFPRSCREAFVALGVRLASRSPEGVTTYDGLGIYRILAGGEHAEEVDGFVREWLGPLLDYDAAHRSELVKTLSNYLECGGNYDETAGALSIHRSTLRYRLQRIREITGLDLGDVDSRFNLHAATRAWRVMGGAR